MHYSKWIATLLSVSMLAGCTEPNGAPGQGIFNGGAPNKQDVGTGIGAVGGALIGGAFGGGAGQVAAVLAGALLGGALGNTIGKSLDDQDRAAYDRASQRAMETGTARHWNNPDSGNSGTIIPRRSFTDSDGEYCREYSQTITVDGEKHSATGVACRKPDGNWQIKQ